MAGVAIKINVAGANGIARRLSNLSMRLPSAIADGLNEGGDRTRTQVQRALRQQTGAIRLRSITDRVRTMRAHAGGLSYRMVVAGKPAMKLDEFKWRATSAGITADVWNTPHAFKRSFLNKGKGSPFKARTTSKRFPLRTLYGPNLAKELGQGIVPSVFLLAAHEFVGPAIIKRMARLLG